MTLTISDFDPPGKVHFRIGHTASEWVPNRQHSLDGTDDAKGNRRYERNGSFIFSEKMKFALSFLPFLLFFLGTSQAA